jgi:hypothetical protein
LLFCTFQATKLLEFYQAKKFTLTIRESVRIEKEQLNIFQNSIKSMVSPDAPLGHENVFSNRSGFSNASSATTAIANNSGAMNDCYNFDFSKPSTRWALAEVAKSVQHIANISCLPKEEMQVSDFIIPCFSFFVLILLLLLLLLFRTRILREKV